MLYFMIAALVVVVGVVALVALGGGRSMADSRRDGFGPVLPPDRPMAPKDVDALRFSIGVRGYRMDEVDEVLDRLAAELAERAERIASLEAAARGGPDVAGPTPA